MTTRDASWLAWLSYAAVVLIWGSTYFASAVGFESFTPIGMLTVRFAIAATLCLLVARVRREQMPTWRGFAHLGVVGAVMLGASNALVIWALQHIPTGMAAVFMALTPLWLIVLGWGREQFGRMKVMGISLGIVGVGLLVWPDKTAELHRGGLLAMFAAPIIWAWGTLYAKRHVTGTATFTNLGFEMFAATLFGLAIVPFAGGILSGPLTSKAVIAIGYLSVVGSLVGYVAYFYLVRVWQPSSVGTFSYLTPIVAILLGTTFLHENLNLQQLSGMFIILVAVALVQKKGRSTPISRFTE